MNMLQVMRERISPDAVLDWVRDFATPMNLLKAGAWLVYGCLVFAVVFTARYFLLQADELARKAVAGLPGVRVEFPLLEPELVPPRAFLDYLRVVDARTGRTIAEMKDAEIRVAVLPLLVGKARVSMAGRMFGGIVRADVASGALFDTDWLDADIRAEMVELQSFPQVRAYDRSMTGFLDADASLSGPWADPVSMNLRIAARLSALDMENRYPVIKGPRIKGFTIDLEGGKQDNELQFARLDIADGEDVSLKLEGVVTLVPENVGQSRLDMRGRFLGTPERLAVSVLDPEAVNMLKRRQAVPVSVQGVLERPDVRMK
ncbi:hypothetical protein [Pseudodesulfovibrio tunisiensis]|uniref:hypothetical protein n=1 Tax=Pseudodesulfovibrio tunisiensis TaxID=463192 RepID=UPI001FB252EA|nr:hypothetical protein [Pseudodesulfovibrio tunisiensis]